MNYIKLRKNNLCVENISALQLAKKYKTPFYCYSLSQLKSNYRFINDTFKDVKPIICFSVKSNSNLTILKELKRLGSGADVVSIGELLKATKAGIRGNKIVFPMGYKTQEQLKEFNLDLKSNILVTDPIGYLEFMYLMKNSDYVISDSGTVVEEACIIGKPSIQMRHSTERPEVYDVSSSIKFDPSEDINDFEI